MLERTSRFILEVFPYLSGAVIAQPSLFPGTCIGRCTTSGLRPRRLSLQVMKTPVKSSVRTTPRLRPLQDGRIRASRLQTRQLAEAKVAYP
jgi:hypothetical protein